MTTFGIVVSAKFPLFSTGKDFLQAEWDIINLFIKKKETISSIAHSYFIYVG